MLKLALSLLDCSMLFELNFADFLKTLHESNISQSYIKLASNSVRE
jgi:hypothetical protein